MNLPYNYLNTVQTSFFAYNKAENGFGLSISYPRQLQDTVNKLIVEAKNDLNEGMDPIEAMTIYQYKFRTNGIKVLSNNAISAR